LCNNLADRTIINFIGNNSNCQKLTSTNESPHSFNVSACSHRGGASRLQFIFRHFLPIYEISMPLKYLST
jgi:hypothetical protein